MILKGAKHTPFLSDCFTTQKYWFCLNFLPHQKTRKNIDPSTTFFTLKGAKHTPFLSDCFTKKKTRKDIAPSKTLKLNPKSLVLTGLKLEVKS